MTPTTSKNSDNTSSRTHLMIKRLQSSEKASEQDTNAGQDDVLIQWDDHAVLREG